jgi:hypothetical protein
MQPSQPVLGGQTKAPGASIFGGSNVQRTPLAFKVHLLRQKKRHLRITPDVVLAEPSTPIHWTSKRDHAADVESELNDKQVEKKTVEGEIKELPTGSMMMIGMNHALTDVNLRISQLEVEMRKIREARDRAFIRGLYAMKIQAAFRRRLIRMRVVARRQIDPVFAKAEEELEGGRFIRNQMKEAKFRNEAKLSGKLLLVREKQLREHVAKGAGADEWVAMFDARRQKFYFYNKHTRETTWKQPSSFVATADDQEMKAIIRIQTGYRVKMARRSMYVKMDLARTDRKIQDTLQRSYGVMTGQIELRSKRLVAEGAQAKQAIVDQQRLLVQEGASEWVEAYDSKQGEFYYHRYHALYTIHIHHTLIRVLLPQQRYGGGGVGETGCVCDGGG